MNVNKVTRVGIAVSVLVMLGACAGPSQTMLADGTVAFRIDCDGASSGMNYCFERAGKSCGAKGYMIVDASGNILSGSAVSDADMSNLSKAWQDDQSSILVACGK